MQQSPFCESCKQYVKRQHLRAQLTISHIQANIQAYVQTQAHCYKEIGGNSNMTSPIHMHLLLAVHVCLTAHT